MSVGFDVRAVCKSCGSWCCQEDAPYMSDEEAALLGFKFEAQTRCPCLSASGDCEAYGRRPFECRAFPFTLQAADDGSLLWCVWDVCPAVKSLDLEACLKSLESSLPLLYSADYIKDYLEKEELSWDRYDRMGLSPRPLRKVAAPEWASLRI